MTELHSFREMLDHLESGGAAHRYGSYYPLYRIEPRGLIGKSLKRRMFGGSMGEYENGDMTSATFSPDEQQSNDWVFIDGEELKRREERAREDYQRQLRERPAPTPAPPRFSWLRRLFH